MLPRLALLGAMTATLCPVKVSDSCAVDFDDAVSVPLYALELATGSQTPFRTMLELRSSTAWNRVASPYAHPLQWPPTSIARTRQRYSLSRVTVAVIERVVPGRFVARLHAPPSTLRWIAYPPIGEVGSVAAGHEMRTGVDVDPNWAPL